VAERIAFDYGYDLTLRTFDENGELEPGFALLQVKATDSPQWVEDNQFVALPIDTGDLIVWLREPMPVFLILYDVAKEVAYWLQIDERSVTRPVPEEGTLTMRLPVTQTLDAVAIDEFRRRKQAAVRLA
jgi:hypothetical protein